MQALELKIHPPVILLLSVGLAYVCSHYLPFLALPLMLSGLYGYIAGTGILVALAGIWEFRKAKTTINPTKPEKASFLVSSGVYRVTRNPMYLGMLFIIIAAVFKLGNYYGLIALVFFILYLTQFQIKPEERIIEGIFGDEYVRYKSKVRRWL
jgi:protein-S-isoprenylcysteine O-methyltransferase Ste14